MGQRRQPKGSSKGGEFAPGPTADRPAGANPPGWKRDAGGWMQTAGRVRATAGPLAGREVIVWLYQRDGGWDAMVEIDPPPPGAAGCPAAVVEITAGRLDKPWPEAEAVEAVNGLLHGQTPDMLWRHNGRSEWWPIQEIAGCADPTPPQPDAAPAASGAA